MHGESDKFNTFFFLSFSFVSFLHRLQIFYFQEISFVYEIQLVTGDYKTKNCICNDTYTEIVVMRKETVKI